jgi:hypothetical protein
MLHEISDDVWIEKILAYATPRTLAKLMLTNRYFYKILNNDSFAIANLWKFQLDNIHLTTFTDKSLDCQNIITELMQHYGDNSKLVFRQICNITSAGVIMSRLYLNSKYNFGLVKQKKSSDTNTAIKLVFVSSVYPFKCNLLHIGFLGCLSYYAPTVFDNNCFKNTFVSHSKKKESDFTFNVWDTSGTENYHRIRSLIYPGTNYYVYVFDMHRPLDLQGVETWIAETNSQARAPYILLGVNWTHYDNECNNYDMLSDFISSGRVLSKEIIISKCKEIDALGFIELRIANDPITDAKQAFDAVMRVCASHTKETNFIAPDYVTRDVVHHFGRGSLLLGSPAPSPKQSPRTPKSPKSFSLSSFFSSPVRSLSQSRLSVSDVNILN